MGLLISAQAQTPAISADLSSLTQRRSTVSITATNDGGTAVTSYSNSTDVIKIPITWRHLSAIDGSSLRVELATFFDSDDVELVRFEGAESDQNIYTLVSDRSVTSPPQHYAIPYTGSAVYCTNTGTLPSFCSDGADVGAGGGLYW